MRRVTRKARLAQYSKNEVGMRTSVAGASPSTEPTAGVIGGRPETGLPATGEPSGIGSREGQFVVTAVIHRLIAKHEAQSAAEAVEARNDARLRRIARVEGSASGHEADIAPEVGPPNNRSVAASTPTLTERVDVITVQGVIRDERDGSACGVPCARTRIRDQREVIGPDKSERPRR